MALKHIILLFVMSAGVAVAQPTIFVTTNNHNTLNPETDALSGLAGSFRITHTVTDGVDPLSFEYLQSPIVLKCVNQADAFTNLFASAFATNDPGTVRWFITNLNAGVYTLDSDIVIGGDTIKIFWRYLTVTNIGTGATTINITNSVTGATIASGAVQVAVTVTQEQAVASMSLVPLIASNGAIGTQTYPWGEINVVTGRFDTLSISNLNVAGAISAVDTSKVPLVGGNMTGFLTNLVGFVGNGAGLTNVPVSLALSIVTNGSGNVVTNLSVGGMVVTQQLGTVSSGAGGTLQWYTNAYGPHWTNSAGYVEWLEGPYQAGTPTNYFQDYDSLSATMSNRNATWVHYVTNGALVVVVPNESTGLRQYDYKTVTSGVWWRAAAKINGYPIRTTSSGSGSTQAGLSVHLHNGSNMMWGIYCAAAQPTYRLANYNSTFAAAGTPYGVAPYDNTGASLFPDRSPNNQDWLLMDSDGTSVWRCFTAKGIHAPEMALMVTNVGWTVQAISLGVAATGAGTGRSTNSFYEIDSWQIQEGALWLPASAP